MSRRGGLNLNLFGIDVSFVFLWQITRLMSTVRKHEEYGVKSTQWNEVSMLSCTLACNAEMLLFDLTELAPGGSTCSHDLVFISRHCGKR